MKQSYLLTSSLFLLFACAACEEDDKMDMDKTEKNQEKFTCGEFEYQVIKK